MSLAFLAKKSWHTSNLRNVEKVWIAEQKHAAEEKKLEELKKNIEEERQLQELRKLQAAHGNKSAAVERVDWMYQGPMSGMAQKTTEEFLLGKEYKTEDADSDLKKLGDAKYGALALNKAALPANDTFSRLNEDPMMLIRRQQQSAQENILKNPVKMKKIKSEVEKMLQEKKEKKKLKKKLKKEAKRERKHGTSKSKSKRERSSSEDAKDDEDHGNVALTMGSSRDSKGSRRVDRSPERNAARRDDEARILRERHGHRSPSPRDQKERKSRSRERTRHRYRSPSRSWSQERRRPDSRSRRHSRSRSPAARSRSRSRSRDGMQTRRDRKTVSSDRASRRRSVHRDRSRSADRHSRRDRRASRHGDDRRARSRSASPRTDHHSSRGDRGTRSSCRRDDGAHRDHGRAFDRETSPKKRSEYAVKRPNDGGRYGLISREGAAECEDIDKSTLGPNTKFVAQARDKKRQEEEELRRKLAKTSQPEKRMSREEMLRQAEQMAADAKARDDYITKRAAEKKEQLDQAEQNLSKNPHFLKKLQDDAYVHGEGGMEARLRRNAHYIQKRAEASNFMAKDG